MARLIRTEKEVEGHYSEQWIVVEEDPLDRWPAGPLRSSGARRGSTVTRAPAARRVHRGVRCPGCFTPPSCGARTPARA